MLQGGLGSFWGKVVFVCSSELPLKETQQRMRTHLYASSLLPGLGEGRKVFFMTALLLSDSRFANEQDLAVSC